jgi:hypothetical protein
MNDLEKYFRKNDKRLIHKWIHYFEIYDRHFSRYRGKDVVVVEFGISQGGSLQMWKNYFGPNAKIFGVDINPHCKQFEEEQVEIFIGDQEDRTFLKSIAKKVPHIDILIDDGGHMMKQQINTYEELFPLVAENGVYLCEEVHTSYWPNWGGGVKNKNTFIEYSKNFIDYLHGWHSVQKGLLKVSDFTKSVHSLTFYDSVLVIEKRPIKEPYHEQTGHASIPGWEPPMTIGQRIKGRIRGIFGK